MKGHFCVQAAAPPKILFTDVKPPAPSMTTQTILREFDGEVQTRRLMSLILHSMDQEKTDRRPDPDEKGGSDF